MKRLSVFLKCAILRGIRTAKGPVSVMSAREKHVLTIDLGTSGPKVALFSDQGELVGHERGATEIILLPGGGAEQRPDDWWASIKSCTQRLLGRNLVPVEQIAAVCCTAQWSGTVPVDKDGVPLRNAIIWMDSRGAPQIEELMAGPIKVEGYNLFKLLRFLRLTGGVPGHAGKDSLAHILWLKANEPQIYARAHKLLEPKDYLNARLTGRFTATYDSIALHWLTDNRKVERVVYDDRLLKMTGVDRDKLPDLVRAVDVLGPLLNEVAAELGLSPQTQVIAGTPDMHSAAVGSGAVRDYEGHLYVGTSSWLQCHVPFKKLDLRHNMTSLPSAIPGRYFLANEQECAGACLEFLKNNVIYHEDELLADADLPDVYKLFDKIVGRVPAGSEGVIFTPWLVGERTPIEDHRVRGGMHNLSLHNTREHMIRAVFEGVALNMRWLHRPVEKYVKRRVDNIHFIGGGASSAEWCQIFADVLGRTIKQVAEPLVAGPRGAAFLALVALGELTFDDVAERVRIQATFEPDPGNRELYDGLFKEFVALYKHNRKIHRRLARIVGQS